MSMDAKIHAKVIDENNKDCTLIVTLEERGLTLTLFEPDELGTYKIRRIDGEAARWDVRPQALANAFLCEKLGASLAILGNGAPTS